MLASQAAIADGIPALARYLTFQLLPDADPRAALAKLKAMELRPHVVGIGASTVSRLGARIDGLREPTCLSGAGVSIPADPAALWCWLRGDDRGQLLHEGKAVAAAVSDSFALDSVIDAFTYDGGRDLSGYEDGTENPTGADAERAAFVAGAGPGLDGSSFVAVQTWAHDLERFEAMPRAKRDEIIGRRHSDNEEMEDAPSSAHVKRTAQESFEPPAFILRRSMPWADSSREGLIFVAFGHSFDPFEAILRRMVGIEDGTTDGLFRFTQPMTTTYFWCPPVSRGMLDLRAIGL